MATDENARPPDGARHYGSSEDMPENIQKYWHQRYDIFSEYDKGIWMTDDAWFGVAPEPIANKIAEHIAAATPRSKSILIDCFAGAGGNTIAFALSGRFSQIFALERDPSVLACAKHNASLYGVEKDIFWIQGDCFDLLRKRLKGVQRSAVLFASPPWGGPEYSCSDVFDLESMQPYGLREMYEAFSRFSRHVVLYLPRTSDLRQVAGYGEDVDTVLFDRAKEGDGVSRTKVEQGPGSSEKTVTVKHYCMRGASKAMCVYYGDFYFE